VAIHKRRPQSAEGGTSVEKGEVVLQMRRPHFLVHKTSFFRNLWCVRTGKGVEPVQTRRGGHF